jgi:hypothetical protein
MVPFVGPLTGVVVPIVVFRLDRHRLHQLNQILLLDCLCCSVGNIISLRRIVYCCYCDSNVCSTAYSWYPESQTWIVITSVPKDFGFGVYTYVPSALITIAFVVQFTGVVVTTNGVPSGSISPLAS